MTWTRPSATAAAKQAEAGLFSKHEHRTGDRCPVEGAVHPACRRFGEAVAEQGVARLVLVAMGNVALVGIGLGLWWKWRLMWLAA
ncbi:hypothetical protein ACNF49_35225 [Actinomadura sp. ATCC 39365]|uniref:hypothetical protein n=1 Tax=Nonomuraea sp. NPDC005692 TaxID=3157168 RepID=UPI00340FE255